MLFAIYFIAVLALAVSAYALWSLEEIRKYYERKNTVSEPNAWEQYKSRPPVTPTKGKGHWD